MLAAKTRSGLVETIHEGSVAVVGPSGDLVAWSGDIDRPFFLRSAAKPFQAKVAQDEGALMRPTELALAAASHDGDPVHVAIVSAMLGAVGLSESDLGCPPDHPLGESARSTVPFGVRRSIYHNCSGKHASWLRACMAQGWPIESYLSPDHPLQIQIRTLVADLGDFPATPAGVDGCGAPVFRTTTRVMARLYSRLSSTADLSEVFSAMHQYPALVSGYGNGDAAIAVSLNAAAKRGADGCLGIGVAGGLGLAVKSWDGTVSATEVAAIATLDALGLIPPAAASALEGYARPVVRGGLHEVGALEPRLELRFA